MTDKVHKIREEVERLKSQLVRGACASQMAMETRCKEEAYNEVLAILDTLKKEPVSIDFEQELYKAFGQVKDFTLGMQIAKWFYNMGKDSKDSQEPVSEDLKEAIDTYLSTYFGGEKEKQDWPFLKKMAIHFANWNKQKDGISASEDLESFVSGYREKYWYPDDIDKFIGFAKQVANWQKQQMMKEAVKVNISNASIVSLPVNCNLKVGDKVLIIKED